MIVVTGESSDGGDDDDSTHVDGAHVGDITVLEANNK